MAVLALLAPTVAACGSRSAGAAPEPEAARSAPWKAPPLDDPITVRLDPSDPHLELDPARDYRIVAPDHPITQPVSISGGHDVVWVGGAISIPSTVPATTKNAGRGLYLLNQTGTIHVEGVSIGGLGLSEGINLSEPQGRVQLRNLHIGPIRARTGVETHPDVVQSWAGPRVLRIDGLSAITDYQGIFLQPQAYGPVDVQRVDLRNIDITGTSRSAYLLWQATPVPLRVRDVWIRGPRSRPTRQLLWPTPRAWRGVHRGRVRPFVDADRVGVGYRAGADR